jgi:hypothetical protein
MKKTALLLIVLVSFFSCQETKKDKNRRDYKVGEKFEIDGKEYEIKEINNYANGNNQYLCLKVDTLNTIYEKHITFYHNGVLKNIFLTNPKVDTSIVSTKKENGSKVILEYLVGYRLEERLYDSTGVLIGISERKKNIIDSICHMKNYNNNKLIDITNYIKRGNKIILEVIENDKKETYTMDIEKDMK